MRIVIEDWEGDHLRQMSAHILRDGEPINDMDEIRAIYARSDFPKKGGSSVGGG